MSENSFDVKETSVAAFALISGIALYLVKTENPRIGGNIVLLSILLLLICSSLVIFTFMNGLRLFYSFTLGLLVFSVVNLAVLLGGTYGLGDQTPQLVDGLNRLSLAILAIWKITSDMRNLPLDIRPDDKEHGAIYNALYGILFPFQDFRFLVKVLLFVFFSFFLVMSGLQELSQGNVNTLFLAKTEKIGINLLFLGIQTPMMMSSRANVSRTFSNYISNLQKTNLFLLSTGKTLPSKYHEILSSSKISFAEINGNGKHLWLSVALIILLQAYQDFIIQLQLLDVDSIRHAVSSAIALFRTLIP